MDQLSAKIILKDKTLDSMIYASNPKDYEPDDFEYLNKVYKSLKKLKTHLGRIAKNENNNRRKKSIKRASQARSQKQQRYFKRP